MEFLVDPAGQHVFIEMNPRIQVEHTVTEEVTDVDLVQSQLRIAAGATLADLGPHPGHDPLRGAALQCRITTEDPANGFRPDTGKITTYRSPGGPGVRLDGGTTYTGAEVSAHFDSMLVKLTCRGRDFETAVEKARRAVAEFRIRGVSTNIPFLQAVLDDPDFAAGRVTTTFIEERPHLLTARAVRRPRHQAADLPGRGHRQPAARPGAGPIEPVTKLPDVDLAEARPRRFAPAAARSSGPRSSPAGCASRTPSRSPTRRSATPTSRCSPPGSAPATCSRSPVTSRGRRRELLSLEAWGGATYDVALRFLAEDPWDRLAELRRPCRTSACRCCCAAGTRSATRRTRSRSPKRS